MISRGGSLQHLRKKSSPQPLLPYSSNPYSNGKNSKASRSAGRRCARCFCTMLALAAFAAVTTAFTGIPGYVKPRFSVLSSTTNGDSASSKAGVNTDSNRWQDLAALDPEVGMWSHHQKRQRMKQEAARRHHEMRQQATGTAVHGEDPQGGATEKDVAAPDLKGEERGGHWTEAEHLQMGALHEELPESAHGGAGAQHHWKREEAEAALGREHAERLLAEQAEQEALQRQQDQQQRGGDQQEDADIAAPQDPQRQAVVGQQDIQQQQHAQQAERDISGGADQQQPQGLASPGEQQDGSAVHGASAADSQQQRQQEVLAQGAQGAGIQQQIQQEQHGAEEAPVLAAQEPHHGVAAPATGLYALSVRDGDGKEVSLAQYAGKVTVVVNVASQCGYTEANYRGLTKLYKEFHDQGLEVLAFPCNQFGSQEPGTCAEVKKFASTMYDADFPIFDKVDVNGPNSSPVFKFLKENTAADMGGTADIEWNFTKFVVNRRGFPVVRYPSAFEMEPLEGWVKYELTREAEPVATAA